MKHRAYAIAVVLLCAAFITISHNGALRSEENVSPNAAQKGTEGGQAAGASRNDADRPSDVSPKAKEAQQDGGAARENGATEAKSISADKTVPSGEKAGDKSTAPAVEMKSDSIPSQGGIGDSNVGGAAGSDAQPQNSKKIKSDPGEVNSLRDRLNPEHVQTVPDKGTATEGTKAAELPEHGKTGGTLTRSGESAETLIPLQPIVSDTDVEKKKTLEVADAPKSATQRSDYLLGNYLGDTRIMVHYGIFSPISDYGDFYSNTTQMGLGAQLREFSIMRIIPEVHASYAKMESIPEGNRVRSTMELAQLSLGVSYYHDLELPGFMKSIGLKRPLGLFARFRDGITRVEFESDLVSKPAEYIHTVGLSVGAVYPVYPGVYVGPEVGYQYIFTANRALQSIMMAIKAEVRL